MTPRLPAHRVTTAHMGAAYPFQAERGLGGRAVFIGQAMAGAGDKTARTMLEAVVKAHVLDLARIALALAGALSVPDPPAVPKQARMDAIAATVLELTGWTSVANVTVEAIYGRLFGDEALFLAGEEMKLEAGVRMLENPGSARSTCRTRTPASSCL